MIDVEQRALRSLQQHRLTVLERLVQQQPGVGDAMPEALRLLQKGVEHLVRVERLAVVDLDEHLVLEFQCGLDLLRQRGLVQHVGGANAEPRDLVLIARPDAATRRADLVAAHVALCHLVDRHVVGHQKVGVCRDQQSRGVDTAVLEALELGEQHTRIDDDAVADDVGDTGREDPRRDEVKGEVLAVG